MQSILEKIRLMVEALAEKLQASSAMQTAKTVFDKDSFQPDSIKEQVSALSKDVGENPQKYFVIAVIGVVILFVLFADYGIVQRMELEYDRYHLQSELEGEKARTKEFEEKIRHAQDMDEIERIAREKFGLSRQDETVYIIKP
jgi:cell division protein FtsB